MSGKDLGERLRERHPDLRVLFMSGYTDNGRELLVAVHEAIAGD